MKTPWRLSFFTFLPPIFICFVGEKAFTHDVALRFAARRSAAAVGAGTVSSVINRKTGRSYEIA
ncbi:TPA: hypothetical protein ACKQBX_004720 [Serratia marcescens]